MHISFLMTPRQQRILSTTLLSPDASFSFSDLLRSAGPGHGATQRYLKQLVVEKVLIVDNERPQPRYGANTAHPLYAELHALLAKTVSAME